MLSFTPFNYHKADDQIIKNINQYIKNPEHVFQGSELLGTEPVGPTDHSDELADFPFDGVEAVEQLKEGVAREGTS